MNGRLATMLMLGMGFMPEMSGAWAAGRPRHEMPAGSALVQRTGSATVLRRASFDHLRSAGRFRRGELATFSLEDGRLWVEWSGVVPADTPVRVETGELDAEWMAHAPSGAQDGEDAARPWYLTRRDLCASADGRYWSVLLCGSRNEAGSVEIVASLEHTARAPGRAIAHVRYIQGPDGVRLAWAQNGRSVELEASCLAKLAEAHPLNVRHWLAPAIRKLADLDIAAIEAA